MSFYHDKKNVEEYIKRVEGYNDREIIAEMEIFLINNAKILELGMGPGTDYTVLSQKFKVTGSDYSEIFIERFREMNPDADLMVLNAINIDTDRTFDGIYSNKVLIHLTRCELINSIERQVQILEPNGIVCHSFWYGDKEEDQDGLKSIFYTEDILQELFNIHYKIIKIEKYQEIEPEDSIYIIAQKK